MTPLQPPWAAPGRQSLHNITKNITSPKKNKFNSATIVYMVQDLEKALCLYTHLKLQFTGFKLQSSCKYVLWACMIKVIFFFIFIL